jgi:hypothetical protein
MVTPDVHGPPVGGGVVGGAEGSVVLEQALASAASDTETRRTFRERI